MSALEKVLGQAAAIYSSRHPRGRYAYELLRGRSAWSLADLRGKAKRYGASYARQRDNAARALTEAGGCLVYAGRHGRLVAAVYVGADDYGTAIYETAIGTGTISPSGMRVNLLSH